MKRPSTWTGGSVSWRTVSRLVQQDDGTDALNPQHQCALGNRCKSSEVTARVD